MLCSIVNDEQITENIQKNIQKNKHFLQVKESNIGHSWHEGIHLFLNEDLYSHPVVVAVIAAMQENILFCFLNENLYSHPVVVAVIAAMQENILFCFLDENLYSHPVVVAVIVEIQENMLFCFLNENLYSHPIVVAVIIEMQGNILFFNENLDTNPAAVAVSGAHALSRASRVAGCPSWRSAAPWRHAAPAGTHRQAHPGSLPRTASGPEDNDNNNSNSNDNNNNDSKNDTDDDSNSNDNNNNNNNNNNIIIIIIPIITIIIIIIIIMTSWPPCTARVKINVILYCHVSQCCILLKIHGTMRTHETIFSKEIGLKQWVYFKGVLNDATGPREVDKFTQIQVL